MKQKLFSILLLAMSSLLSIHINAADYSWAEIKFSDADIAAAGTLDGKVFTAEGSEFKLTLTDKTSSGKMAIDNNYAYFGTSTDDKVAYTHRLKSGRHSSELNAMTLTMPDNGYLRVAVRSANTTDTMRYLILSQGADTLFNEVVKESSSIVVPIDEESSVRIYPYITILVPKGEVRVGYPVNALNFYSFAFTHGDVMEIQYNQDTTKGCVNGPKYAKQNSTITFAATPNYGYHFTKWSDGVTENPRSFVITKDTTFTAEFAKNEYTIATESFNNEWGTTAGGTTALYLEQVEISAAANYGYHFVRWNDYNTSNSRTITITEDKTYTAIFAKNTYSITKIANSEQGSISGISQAEYLDEVTFTANPKYGYHFTQWSDGVKDNPRLFIITQDTTFTAEFAFDRTGTCGNDLALTWTYEPEEKVLTISGEGAFEQNMQCGAEARTALQKLVFANGVTSIGESAFVNCANLKTLVLSKDVKKIYENAFYNCDNLTAIYNYRPTPTNIYANTFTGVDKFECVLYVPDGSVEMYKSDGSNWKDFYFIETMGAASDEHIVTYIDKYDEIIDSEKIKLHLPEAPIIEGFTFLYWQPVAKNIQDGLTIQAVYEANEPTSAPAIYTNPANPAQKLIRNGNVYILTDDKTYTLTGQAVK